jgi:uncharacterized protein (TIGR02145 family)
LYQWGRVNDGHEKRGSALASYSGVYYSGKVADSGTGITDYPWNQANTGSGQFIKTVSAQDYNWAFGVAAVSRDILWRNYRFANNDPCSKIKDDGISYEPARPTSGQNTAANTNWRIPTVDEWSSIYRGNSAAGALADATANTWVWYNDKGKGMEIRPDGSTTTLFLPAGGHRNVDGLLVYQGGHGHYWSSSVRGTNAYYLNFNSGVVISAYGHHRGYGLALRCIKN